MGERILTFAEYAAVRHPTPYLVDLPRGGRRLIVFGVQHSSDPTLPVFGQIERLFAALKPGFALHEGTPPQIENDREVAIRRHGEAGLLRHLASKAGIETASLDIPLADEAAQLARDFGAADALVFLVVRQLASFHRKTARMDFAAYFAEFFETIAPGLGFGAIDWPLVDREHERLLGRPLVPAAVTAELTNPLSDALPTQRIAQRSNRRRDEHMLRCLLAAAAKHPRVLATVGVTHAVMLEPALRSALS